MENQNKSVTFQWFVTSAILMIVVLVMLFNFSIKSSADAEEEVYTDLIQSTQQYADSFLAELETVRMVSQPVIKLLEQKEALDDEEYFVELIEALASESDAYQVCLCDTAGQGINQLGESVSISDTDYFQAILNSGNISYLFTEEADEQSQKTIVIVERVSSDTGRGYLLMYYSMAQFEGLLSKTDLDVNAFLVLVDSEGDILGTSGADNALLEGGNLLETIKDGNSTALQTIRSRMKNGARGNSSVTVNEVSYLLTYIPMGTNQWELFLGVSQAYIDRQVDQKWADIKSMLTSLIVVVFVFICVVMVFNIIARIRRIEKEKQLEDKADTDQLTGLYNKLATERKIKEYMQQHPQSQCMMFMVDVDNFKKINDTMGHAFGDEVLRSLGQQIGGIFRASDIIGRVGGDEFMIFLKDIADEETVRKEARKVENFFKGFQAGEYVKYAATASIGVAIYPQEGGDFETLYKAADQGVYKAKKRGKNQLAFYRDEWEKTE
ncbi:MAG: sensor domain-containing diguanylate cyclase [Clostridiales bacterium]|nr:sensor domain-containing diguanylate cyclase [Clostridiales bacterium]